MDVLFLIGRILLGAYYLYNGIHHFTALGSMTQYTASQGVPMPGIAVIVAGLLLVIGGLSFLFGIYPLLGIASVILFLVPVAVIMHRFWGVDPQTATMQMPNFLKNMALAASALMFAAINRPWPFSLG